LSYGSDQLLIEPVSGPECMNTRQQGATKQAEVAEEVEQLVAAGLAAHSRPSREEKPVPPAKSGAESEASLHLLGSSPTRAEGPGRCDVAAE
jgi:hypothetical protein